jgi:hypothetical protein
MKSTSLETTWANLTVKWIYGVSGMMVAVEHNWDLRPYRASFCKRCKRWARDMLFATCDGLEE